MTDNEKARGDTVAKGRQTWKKNIEDSHPELVGTLLEQRTQGAFDAMARADECEQRKDYLGTRRAFTGALECATQVNTLTDGAIQTELEQIRQEYLDFVLNRDPMFRQYLAELLPLIQQNPGILQTEVYARTKIEREHVSYCLYFSDVGGIVRREKKGRTYMLFVEGGI